MEPSMSLELLPPSSWKVFWSYMAPATLPPGVTPGCSTANEEASRPMLGRKIKTKRLAIRGVASNNRDSLRRPAGGATSRCDRRGRIGSKSAECILVSTAFAVGRHSRGPERRRAAGGGYQRETGQGGPPGCALELRGQSGPN